MAKVRNAVNKVVKVKKVAEVKDTVKEVAKVKKDIGYQTEGSGGCKL